MCEYAKFDTNSKSELPVCIVNNKLCTLCVFGEAKTYKEAKENEKKLKGSNS